MCVYVCEGGGGGWGWKDLVESVSDVNFKESYSGTSLRQTT